MAVSPPIWQDKRNGAYFPFKFKELEFELGLCHV